jgi:hypothetical protein
VIADLADHHDPAAQDAERDQGEVTARLRRLPAQDLEYFDLDQYCLLSKCIG